MSDKKHILFVSHSSGFYGSERSLFDLLGGLKDEFEISVLLPGDGPLSEALSNINIPVITASFYPWLSIHESSLRNITKSVLNSIAVSKLKKRQEMKSFDLIYSNSLAVDIGSQLAHHFNIPHIWHFREWPNNSSNLYFPEPLPEAIQRISKHTQHIICNSRNIQDTVAKEVINIPRTVVYNGFAEIEISRDPVDSITRLGMMGGVNTNKNQSEAIEALSLLNAANEDFTLHIYGDGPELDALKKKVKTKALEHLVTFYGKVADRESAFNNLDCLLVCSKFESFGRIAVEAMQRGIPVISSNSGGLQEVIEHEVNGLTYQPGDPKSLAKQILIMRNQKELRDQLISNGLQSWKRFNLQAYRSKIIDIITGTLSHSIDQKTNK